jgi:hypothetical protein
MTVSTNPDCTALSQALSRIVISKSFSRDPEKYASEATLLSAGLNNISYLAWQPVSIARSQKQPCSTLSASSLLRIS